jgi:hypothetical protein
MCSERKRPAPGRTAALLAIALGAVAPAACRSSREGSPRTFDHALTLGGLTVGVPQLQRGGDIYTAYCRPCHGVTGDGNGLAAPGLRPPPRDLRLGLYKFAAVAAGQLPNEADFVRTIKGGLHGTGMLAWDIPGGEIDDLIQYVKAFAPRWQKEKAGDPIVASPDPWVGNQAAAVARGRKVYHGLAQCAVACHPAYEPRPDIYADTKELTHIEVRDFRPDPYDPVAKDSDYGYKILSPDFTWSPLRAGDAPADVYRSIAAGIGGTAMPTWKNVLPESDLWAMVHYVRSLVALRGTPAAEALRQSLLRQPPWTPPPPPQPDGGADGGADGR